MLTPSLMFGTIGIALLIGIILLVRFRSKRGNAHPMAGEPERNIAERLDTDRGSPPLSREQI